MRRGTPPRRSRATVWPSRNASWPSPGKHTWTARPECESRITNIEQHGLDARQPHADLAEVHLRLLARGMQLGDRHDLAAGLELAPQAGDAGADRRLGDRRATYSSTRRSQTRRAVWRCLRGALRSATSHSRIDLARTDRASAPLGTPACAAAAAPTCSACRTVRRCTRVAARQRIDAPPSRLSLPARTATSTTPRPSCGEFTFGSHWIGRRWGHLRSSLGLQVGPFRLSHPFARQWRPREARGEVYIVRYADDFVLRFEYRSDAERFREAMRERFASFGGPAPGEDGLLDFGGSMANRAKRPSGDVRLSGLHALLPDDEERGFRTRAQAGSEASAPHAQGGESRLAEAYARAAGDDGDMAWAGATWVAWLLRSSGQLPGVTPVRTRLEAALAACSP